MSAFGISADGINGRSIFSLGKGEWDSPRLRSLLEIIATGGAKIDAYEFDLINQESGPSRLILHAQKLDYDSDGEIRLLVAITDVTETRARERVKDDLCREKGILLQELQHRIANSLQIIASVLMQSARTTASDETRSHLAIAHHRVMSVAEVQRQLSVSSLGQVELCAYLTTLCRSIGASMINDHERLQIEVKCDGTSVPANSSVSLGLIVTELVINSLKHAFPGDRPGKIRVSYRTSPGGWGLAVTDDGVGMPADGETTPAGLGMTLVDALGRQLRAVVRIDDMNPGTRVSIIGNAQVQPLMIAEAA